MKPVGRSFFIYLRCVPIALYAVVALIAAGAPQDQARAAAAPPAQPPSFVIRAVPTATPPPIDGSVASPLWQGAAKVDLAWDFTYHRPATETTTVYLLYDRKFLYVAFVASQTERVVATQHTDDVGFGSDDRVSIFLWPGGVNGFTYWFGSNPNGTHYESSSENANFEPEWRSVGKTDQLGYVVTMRIPLDVVRGSGNGEWRIQFDRVIKTRADELEWAHTPQQTDPSDVLYSGYLADIAVPTSETLPKPRVQVYTLAQTAVPGQLGGSRMGIDVAWPFTPTASFLLTAHPDYSNVEIDQQTIAPQEFRRQLQEVRPFFAQGANFYRNLAEGADSPFLLYTPSLPAPSVGAAIEGKQKSFDFAGFGSRSPTRVDNAQAASWTSDNQRFYVAAQRVAVRDVATTDESQAFSFSVNNLHGGFVYLDYGTDRGTFVTITRAATWAEAGVSYQNDRSYVSFQFQNLGPQFNPADGYVAHNDIKGYNFNAYKKILFAATSGIQSVSVGGSIDRYHSTNGDLNQADQSLSGNVVTAGHLTAGFSVGSAFLLSYYQPYPVYANPVGSLYNQNGAYLGYRLDSNTPSSVSYYRGRFGAGELQTWYRETSAAIATRVVITIDADNSLYVPDASGVSRQWLERAGLSWQLSRKASAQFGARRIIGESPFYSAGTNLSAGFSKLWPREELFVVYGDPSVINSTHAVTVKLIYYLGAPKGT